MEVATPWLTIDLVSNVLSFRFEELYWTFFITHTWLLELKICLLLDLVSIKVTSNNSGPYLSCVPDYYNWKFVNYLT